MILIIKTRFIIHKNGFEFIFSLYIHQIITKIIKFTLFFKLKFLTFSI